MVPHKSRVIIPHKSGGHYGFSHEFEGHYDASHKSGGHYGSSHKLALYIYGHVGIFNPGVLFSTCTSNVNNISVRSLSNHK